VPALKQFILEETDGERHQKLVPQSVN